MGHRFFSCNVGKGSRESVSLPENVKERIRLGSSSSYLLADEMEQDVKPSLKMFHPLMVHFPLFNYIVT